jgi:hypothetical protein
MHRTSKKPLMVAILSSTLVACGMLPAAVALASQPTTQTVRHDFGRLSQAGNRALVDISIARSALFDGHPEAATKLINDARTAMRAAQADDSAFMKAEAELIDVGGQHVSSQANAGAVVWLPVGGDVVLQDDYVSQPAKAKAVADANAALKKGDREGAIKALKLADVNVAYNVDVVPLDKTVSRIDMAASLMGAGKYYEAGQVMNQIQASLRIDQLDINAIR